MNIGSNNFCSRCFALFRQLKKELLSYDSTYFVQFQEVVPHLSLVGVASAQVPQTVVDADIEAAVIKFM